MASKKITLKQTGTSNDIVIDERDIISYVKQVNAIDSGTTDATQANVLEDTGAAFDTLGIKVGTVVQNTTDDTTARVTEVTSATELTLDADIFVSGEDYIIGEEWRLEYDADGASPSFHNSGNSMASVVSQGSPTALVTGDGSFVNADRVHSLTADGSGCDIHYRAMGVDLRVISTTDSKATVLAAINAL